MSNEMTEEQIISEIKKSSKLYIDSLSETKRMIELERKIFSSVPEKSWKYLYCLDFSGCDDKTICAELGVKLTEKVCQAVRLIVNVREVYDKNNKLACSMRDEIKRLEKKLRNEVTKEKK